MHAFAASSLRQALAPVQRARAAEEKLVRACATLSRASIERAAAMGPTLAAAARANAQIGAASASLNERYAAAATLWTQSASGDAIEQRLGAYISDARGKADAIKHSGQWVDAESTIDAYLEAARERHLLELMLDAIKAQRTRPSD